MRSDDVKKIPGGIAVAFQTRRKMFLDMEIAKLRREAQEGPPSQEQYEHVLNALEMAATELWEMQDCITAMVGVHEDIGSAITGLHKLSNLARHIGVAARSGAEIPDGGPDAVRDHFKKSLKEDSA